MKNLETKVPKFIQELGPEGIKAYIRARDFLNSPEVRRHLAYVQAARFAQQEHPKQSYYATPH